MDRNKNYREVPITRYGTRDVYIVQDGVRHWQRHMIRLPDGVTATFQRVNDNNAMRGEAWELQRHDTHRRSTVPAFEYVGPPVLIPGKTIP